MRYGAGAAVVEVLRRHWGGSRVACGPRFQLKLFVIQERMRGLRHMTVRKLRKVDYEQGRRLQAQCRRHGATRTTCILERRQGTALDAGRGMARSRGPRTQIREAIVAPRRASSAHSEEARSIHGMRQTAGAVRCPSAVDQTPGEIFRTLHPFGAGTEAICTRPAKSSVRPPERVRSALCERTSITNPVLSSEGGLVRTFRTGRWQTAN
jgi:hypothetical protein